MEVAVFVRGDNAGEGVVSEWVQGDASECHGGCSHLAHTLSLD